MDRFAIAEHLRGLSADPGDVFKRAQDLLFAGQPGQAQNRLGQALVADLPESSPLNEHSLTVIACRAANGDDGAYRRLIGAAVNGGWPAFSSPGSRLRRPRRSAS